jgi:hypothetical protein
MKKRYTAYLQFANDLTSEVYVEEIDVDARSLDEARRLAQEVLDRDYDGGLVIGPVVERFGLYM